MVRLSPKIRILDLDGSVIRQRRLMRRFEDRAQVKRLSEIGESIRYLALRRSIDELEGTLSRDERNQLTLYGSGDFHHVTASLLRQFDEPLSLVVFDAHPDWDRTSPWACCGSWILEALDHGGVRKIVMAGLESGDIRDWRINVGRIDQILSGRVEFFPYDCPLSKRPGKTDHRLPCAEFRSRRLYSEIRWKTIRDGDWDELIDSIIERLPTRSVYLSIDKDCLREEDALTNWEVGHLAVDQVTRAIEKLSRSKEIVGADITGEYSPIQIRNRGFSALSRWDHPRKPTPGAEELMRNEMTNLKLLAALGFE